MPESPAEIVDRNWDAESVLASLIETSAMSIFAIDLDGRVIMANRAAAELADTPADELPGMTLTTLLGHELTARFANEASGLQQAEPVTFKSVVRPQEGLPLVVQATVLPERTGHPQIAAYVIVTPINDDQSDLRWQLPHSIDSGGVDAIFNSSATAILLFDLNGQIFGANPAMQQMLDYDVESLYGMNVIDLVHEPDRLLPGASEEDPFADLVAGRRSHYQAVRRYIHRDGHLVWAQVTVSAIRGEAGELLYFISIMQDVTELKLLEDVAVIANEMSDSFEAALTAIVEELAVQLGFQAGHVLLAQEETNRVLPTGIWYLSDPDALTNFRALTAATTFSPGSGNVGKVFASQVATLDRDLQASSESLRIAAAIDDGLRTGLFVPMIIHGDVVGVIEFYSTEVRDVDPALLDTLTRIAPQLGWFVERERARQALEQKSAALERSNRDLDHFASVISHDLQEPLRAIGRCAQLLQERYQGQFDEDADQLFYFIADGAERMEQMIADLLRYSRITTRPVEFTLVDLNEVVEDVLQDLQVAIEENDARVAVGELPTVRGNDVQLRQVFQNLIANALRYRAEEPPRIEINARPSGSAWLISVRDNGIGIDPKYHEQIFDIFRRLHRRDEYTGTGIGLAIVKRIIEQHGGRLWVESKEGRGAIFFFTLPIPGGEKRLNDRHDGDHATAEDRPVG